MGYEVGMALVGPSWCRCVIAGLVSCYSIMKELVKLFQRAFNEAMIVN